ncbi:hypothetical protein MAH1_04350 [Sessilibacter sp. MAH1]
MARYIKKTVKTVKTVSGKNMDYRFVKVNGNMKKVQVQAADGAFKAAIRLRNSRKKAIDKELLIHGITG